ncbi:MAG: hypothetical protein KAI53_05420 [Candidatus Aenigmarchaeota archaeon]|nr:hypothetical protein [Candidatus Aenigmarchaeota archaeon]
MALKNIGIAMAEDLEPELREEHGLPDSGMIIIETINPDLRINMKPATDGIRGYLLSLDPFIDAEIPKD